MTPPFTTQTGAKARSERARVADRDRRDRNRAAAEHDSARRTPPPGWTAAAWALYLDDADGGRAACRVVYLPPPDTTPTIAEVASAWED